MRVVCRCRRRRRGDRRRGCGDGGSDRRCGGSGSRNGCGGRLRRLLAVAPVLACLAGFLLLDVARGLPRRASPACSTRAAPEPAPAGRRGVAGAGGAGGTAAARRRRRRGLRLAPSVLVGLLVAAVALRVVAVALVLVPACSRHHRRRVATARVRGGSRRRGCGGRQIDDGLGRRRRRRRRRLRRLDRRSSRHDRRDRANRGVRSRVRVRAMTDRQRRGPRRVREVDVLRRGLRGHGCRRRSARVRDGRERRGRDEGMLGVRLGDVRCRCDVLRLHRRNRVLDGVARGRRRRDDGRCRDGRDRGGNLGAAE